jgi:phosphoribosylanthranilate isomerase
MMEDKIKEINEFSFGEIREISDKIDWHYVSSEQKLSEEFIREFTDKVDWNLVSVYQKLSEEFIKEFADKVNWYYISKHQKLSEKFIRKFSDKLDQSDWNNIIPSHTCDVCGVTDKEAWSVPLR